MWIYSNQNTLQYKQFPSLLSCNYMYTKTPSQVSLAQLSQNYIYKSDGCKSALLEHANIHKTKQYYLILCFLPTSVCVSLFHFELHIYINRKLITHQYRFLSVLFYICTFYNRDTACLHHQLFHIILSLLYLIHIHHKLMMTSIMND